MEEVAAKEKYMKVGVPNFGGSDDAKHIACMQQLHPLSNRTRTTESPRKCEDYRKFYCFGLSLTYKKGCNFALGL